MTFFKFVKNLPDKEMNLYTLLDCSECSEQFAKLREQTL